MKSIKRCILLVCTVLMSVFLIAPITTVHAIEDAYYYENFDITVKVNDKREYEVTEVLDVYFNEERHGIKRTIPLDSNVESYSISNIHVEGAPYSIYEGYSELEIKIGSAEDTVLGHQQYTISYTMEHYQDYDNTADYMYMDLLGTQFDTSILNFHAKVILEDDFTLKKQTITSGYSYTSTNDLQVQTTNKKNVYNYIVDRNIEPYQGITLMMEFDEGTFKNAPIYVHDYTIEKKNVTIQVNQDKSYEVHVKETLTNNKSDTVYVYENLEFNEYMDEYEIKDFNIIEGWDIPYHNSSLISYTLSPLETKQVEYTYTLYSKSIYITNDSDWTLLPFYENVEVKDYTFDITYPSNQFMCNIQAGRDRNTAVVDIDRDENHLMIHNNKTFYQGEGIYLAISTQQGMFLRPTPIWSYGIMALCVLISFGFLISRTTVHHEKPIETVEFYPPNGINSLEAGYLIDGTVDSKDITSMIFYWASRGYLTIEKANKKEYYFRKQSNPDPNTPAYELKLFARFFGCGDGAFVSTSDLEGEFYIASKKATHDVMKQYDRNNRAIFDGKGAVYRGLAYVFSYIPICMSTAAVSFLMTGSLLESIFFACTIAFFYTMFMVPLILFFNQKKQQTLATKIALAIVIVSLSLIAIPILFILFEQDAQAIRSLLTIGIACSFIILACSFDMITYTAFGSELIGRLRGFKTFIKTAEQERLEAMIEEDPEYFYTILPYAQVLHVTKIWEKKFENILMEPPTWYYSDEPFVYRSFIHDMHEIHNNSNSYTSSPYNDSNSSGGGYSGGGGSFSGGGSAGGGSGGGGSSSW